MLPLIVENAHGINLVSGKNLCSSKSELFTLQTGLGLEFFVCVTWEKIVGCDIRNVKSIIF